MRGEVFGLLQLSLHRIATRGQLCQFRLEGIQLRLRSGSLLLSLRNLRGEAFRLFKLRLHRIATGSQLREFRLNFVQLGLSGGHLILPLCNLCREAFGLLQFRPRRVATCRQLSQFSLRSGKLCLNGRSLLLLLRNLCRKAFGPLQFRLHRIATRCQIGQLRTHRVKLRFNLLPRRGHLFTAGGGGCYLLLQHGKSLCLLLLGRAKIFRPLSQFLRLGAPRFEGGVQVLKFRLSRRDPGSQISILRLCTLGAAFNRALVLLRAGKALLLLRKLAGRRLDPGRQVAQLRARCLDLGLQLGSLKLHLRDDLTQGLRLRGQVIRRRLRRCQGSRPHKADRCQSGYRNTRKHEHN